MSQYDWKQPFGYETATEQRHRVEDFNNSYNNNGRQTYQRRRSSNGPSFGLIGALIGLAFKIVFWVFRLVFGIKKKR